MTDYRLYTLASTGHIVRRLDIQLQNDEEALTAAESLIEDRPLEVWSGARRIARVDPHSERWRGL